MHRSENRGLWLLLGLLAMFSLSLFVIPAFVIRPFRHQSESALGLAIEVKRIAPVLTAVAPVGVLGVRSEEHTSEIPSHFNLVFRLLLEKKKKSHNNTPESRVIA